MTIIDLFEDAVVHCDVARTYEFVSFFFPTKQTKRNMSLLLAVAGCVRLLLERGASAHNLVFLLQRKQIKPDLLAMVRTVCFVVHIVDAHRDIG